jgi:hypothetical protein
VGLVLGEREERFGFERSVEVSLLLAGQENIFDVGDALFAR